MKPRLPPTKQRLANRRIAVIAAAALGLVGVGGPAFALWQTSATNPGRTIYLGTAGFRVEPEGNFLPVVSQNGERVVLDLGDEFIGAAFDNARPGLPPLNSFVITGWADGNYGLDYRLDVKATGSVVAIISPLRLSSGECTPAGLDAYWWDSEGLGQFVENMNDKPFELQAAFGKPGDRARDSYAKWCITFPVYRGYYNTTAQASGHYTDPAGVHHAVMATDYWQGRTVRTKDTVAGSHLVITATPILKGK